MTKAFQGTVPVLGQVLLLYALLDGECQEQLDEKVVHALVFPA